VTLFDFDELLVCRYDPQLGMWPNLFKTHQLILVPRKSFSFYPLNETYLVVFLSILKP
jgi:hypothetical protein